jgi:hypothetical protein
MENLAVGNDPVFQAAARIAGFSEAAVIDTDTGKVVMTRHRRNPSGYAPFHHLDDGEHAAAAFYGCAFWERADVVALFTKKGERRAQGLERIKRDIRGDFRGEVAKMLRRRVDGREDLIKAIAALGAAEGVKAKRRRRLR